MKQSTPLKRSLKRLATMIVLVLLTLSATTQVLVCFQVEDASWNKLPETAVKLYEGNEMIYYEWSLKSDYSLELDTGQIYTIEVSKEHFLPKRIWIDTHVGDYEGEPLDFEYTVELNLASRYTIYDGYDDVTDYPVALIYFDHDKELFRYSRPYRKSTRSDLNDLRDKVKDVEVDMPSTMVLP